MNKVKQTASQEVISQSYLRGLILKCGLLFAAGLLLTGGILYLSAPKPLGPSYQETFARLAQLKDEMLVKSALTYLLLTGLILAGVILITVLYSHRVVGPLVNIKRVVKAVTGGDLTAAARLRRNDAIKPMADSLNALIETYHKRVQTAIKHANALNDLTNRPGDPPAAPEIIAQAKAVKDSLATLRLQ